MFEGIQNGCVLDLMLNFKQFFSFLIRIGEKKKNYEVRSSQMFERNVIRFTILLSGRF